MNTIQQILSAVLMLFVPFFASAQVDNDEVVGSVIQTLTPSKLIAKGQYDIKWFNNLYTQTKSTFTDGKEPRQTFFTSTVEGYTGISDTKRVNLGLILEFRSNVIANRVALDVFKFDGERGTARSGITSFAPSVKFVPFEKIGNFSVQSSIFIPLVDNEVEEGVFLDQKSYIWQNRFFYDYTFASNAFQLFTELNSELSFGKEAEFNNADQQIDGGFANNSLNLTPGIFLSYFPSSKFTVLALAQHSQRFSLGNNFTQNYTALGCGAKYQLTQTLNVEALYTDFVRGDDTGLGQTFNIGLRTVF